MECPRCDGQGKVLRVKVKANNLCLRLCDECDAVWPITVEMNLSSFQDFSTYMNSIGLGGLWSEIEILSDETETGE